MTKYRAIPTVIDNIRFASKKEAARYSELKIMERVGLIRGLRLQPIFPLEVNGQKVGKYVGDFSYEENGQRITEDVKGMKTPVYRLKKKMVLAQYGIEIREV